MRIICILEYKGFHHNGTVIINRLKHGSDLLPVNVSSATGDAAVGFPGVKMRKAMVVGCITYGVGHVILFNIHMKGIQKQLNFIVAGSFRDTDAFLSRVDKKLFIPVYNFQADNDIIIVKDMAQLPQACNAVFPCTLPLLRTLRIRPDRMPQPG